MADRTFDIVAKSIVSITILKNDQGQSETITNQEHISQFLKSIDNNQANIIIEKIKAMNNTGINTRINFVCDSCEHEWEQQIDFDPTSFFV